MSLQRKTILGAIAALVIAGGFAALLAARDGSAVGTAHAADAPQAAQVDVASVLRQNITDWQDYSGRLQAVDHVDVRALVPGTIMAVYFKDGALVKKGDPLFLIDPRPYEAAADQAEAQLAAAKAKAAFADTDFARAKKLLSDNAIAKRDYDQKANDALAADADVKAAQAALETAQINLGYTRITAPVSGRVSRAEITVGNIIAAGVNSPPLTTLVSVSPIYATFDVDEQTYLKYLSRNANVHGNGKGIIPVRLGLADESGYSRTGRIETVDNQLDSGSGTIRVRATFDNADGALIPGLYARVSVGGGAPHPAILIDDRAVSTDQAKKFVLVVDAQNRAQYREVKLGNMYQGFRVITSGLQPGERIVVSGLQRVRPGSPVQPHEVPMTGEQGPMQAQTQDQAQGS
jgi:multidrug efflux system membrane fusion protein